MYLSASLISLLFTSFTVVQAQTQASTCTVSSSGNAVSAINTAFSECATGGTVVFPAGKTFDLDDVLRIEDLQDVTVQFDSTINLPEYNTKFEDEKAFIYITGEFIHWNGTGKINGNGQEWYNEKNRNAPPLFKPKAKNSYFGGFQIFKAPRSHFSINGCENTLFENLFFNTTSDSEELDAHNTDAFDVSGSSDITIRSSTIINGDDCIAVNHGMKNLTVTGLSCTGSHGFSVGSLGKEGSDDESVSGLNFTSNECYNCQNGVRIKTWPGGKGSVTGITFKDIYLEKAENPVIVTTHYCDNNQMEYCNGEDSHSLSISDVVISGISGTAAEKKNPVLSVNCSTETPCKDFTITDISIEPSEKSTENVCINLEGSDDISYCN